jgi:hypothetical protein
VHAVEAGPSNGSDVVARIAEEIARGELLPAGAEVVVVGASPGSRPGQTDFVRVIRL